MKRNLVIPTSMKAQCIFFFLIFSSINANTRDVFYVRREVDLMKTAKVNAYIMHIFGKSELLSVYAT